MADSFEREIEVTAASIDAYGHVNNLEFVRWMQDVAIAHADERGATAATAAAGAGWFARSHHIQYERPAFLGERIRIRTWIGEPTRKVSSTRKYEFVRVSDQTVLARAETEWVLVDLKTGRPRPIPASLLQPFGEPARPDNRSGGDPIGRSAPGEQPAIEATPSVPNSDLGADPI